MVIACSAPLHAGTVGEHLSIKKVIVPISQGGLSVFGILVADVEHDHAKVVAITPDNPTRILSRDPFQELDLACSHEMEKNKPPLAGEDHP